MSDEELRGKILKEMIADHSNALEKNFPLAKEMIKITKEGKVDVFVKDRLVIRDRVVLYLIGKRYAHTAGLAGSEYVKNEELMTELGLKEGSLLPAIMELRNAKMLVQGTKEGRVTNQAIALNVIESELKAINSRLNKSRSLVSDIEQNGGK